MEGYVDPLIPHSYPTHTPLIPHSYPSHTSLIPLSYLTHTPLIPHSYPTHTSLIPLSYLTHTPLIPLSYHTHIGNVGLSSDFISGFCGETDDEHQENLSLLREVGFDQAFTYSYSRRDQTFAGLFMKVTC